MKFKDILVIPLYIILLIFNSWKLAEMNLKDVYESRYSRMDQVKLVELNMVYLGRSHHFTFFKSCFPQVLLGSLLTTSSHMCQPKAAMKQWRMLFVWDQIFFFFQDIHELIFKDDDDVMYKKSKMKKGDLSKFRINIHQ